jgi:hypothetical protein
MPEHSPQEIELFKKLTAQAIADEAEGIIKKRFILLSVFFALLSAIGAGGLIYQILSSTVLVGQERAVREIERTIIHNDSLNKSIGASTLAIEKARQDLEKMKAETEKLLTLIAESKGVFDGSREQLAGAQQRNADSLEGLIKLVRAQSEAIQNLLSNPKLSSVVGGGAGPQPELESLKSALQKGEATVQQSRDAAQNSRYVVFIHLPQSAAVPPGVENDIRQMLVSAGYVVAGITRDGAGLPRIDYFFPEDADIASNIADSIRAKYPAHYANLRPKDTTGVRNSRGYFGLWL